MCVHGFLKKMAGAGVLRAFRPINTYITGSSYSAGLDFKVGANLVPPK